jgi:hypothetical protein
MKLGSFVLSLEVAIIGIITIIVVNPKVSVSEPAFISMWFGFLLVIIGGKWSTDACDK